MFVSIQMRSSGSIQPVRVRRSSPPSIEVERPDAVMAPDAIAQITHSGVSIPHGN